MAISHPSPGKRKIGVHVSLDLEILGKLDAAAGRMGLSRSELLRVMVEEWTEREAEAIWLANQAGAAVLEARVPWEQAKAELGL